MTDIEFRPADEAEMDVAAEVFITTVNDLAARRGLPRPLFI
jgi:hypothetical protein